MIRLRKSSEPQILNANSERWLEKLEEAIAAGDEKRVKSRRGKYNHADIKAALRAETHGKCAFCECDVTAVAHGDIEHLFPKSLDVSKTFEWSNLGYACQLCNQSKSNHDPNFERIIDPYTTDPEPFIRFFGPFINSNGTTEGRQTIHHLKLERAGVFERRVSTLKSLIKSIELIQTAKTAEERAVLVGDFEANELGSELEFTAMRNDFWRAYRPPVD